MRQSAAGALVMSLLDGGMAAEEGGHACRASIVEDCVAGPARRHVEVGRGSAGRRGWRGLAVPLLALLAAAGVAFVEAVPATFVEDPLTVYNTQNVRKGTLGTPIDGRKLAVPCGLDYNAQPVCAMSALTWGELVCPESSICFVVAANGATPLVPVEFQYTPSPNLLKKINDGVIKTSTFVLRQPSNVVQVRPLLNCRALIWVGEAVRCMLVTGAWDDEVLLR